MACNLVRDRGLQPTYGMKNGFNMMQAAIKKFIAEEKKSTHKKTIFEDDQCDEGVIFTSVLRKYVYEAVLGGQIEFSGFFRIDIGETGQMTIEYFIIEDPQTVAGGITLMSAIAGFFFDDQGAEAAKEKDFPKDPTPSGSKRARKSGGDASQTKKLEKITESYEPNELEIIRGNTYCRVVHNTQKRYPSLKLPSTVFTKLYHYDRNLLEDYSSIDLVDGIPNEETYYNMFLHELEINERISQSQFAYHFPKLLVSGYWNGHRDRPMHIFQYLGEEMPKRKWDRYKVHRIVEERLQELHSLGNSHNDIRIPNIHVSTAGKVSLIDFGLSDNTNNQKNIERDMMTLDHILGSQDCPEWEDTSSDNSTEEGESQSSSDNE
ncbi:uncharacterized protein RJT20DRAFT_137068 [Scheffersomyces xylosifermentans]|uniref:uncharacterized protein n=1 Tax=Scheffersomyces xylosifermentans TaxID=1304137 RepID=UPI00315C7F0E